MESKQHLCHSQFALVLLKLGRKNKDRVLIESSLSTCLELLCQSDPNNMCNRFRVPFILLDLDRDDDAYCFLKWWVIVDKVNKRRFATFYYIEMCYTYCSLKSCCSDDQATFILDLLNLTSLIKISIMICKNEVFHDFFTLFYNRQETVLSWSKANGITSLNTIYTKTSWTLTKIILILMFSFLPQWHS